MSGVETLLLTLLAIHIMIDVVTWKRWRKRALDAEARVGALVRFVEAEGLRQLRAPLCAVPRRRDWNGHDAA